MAHMEDVLDLYAEPYDPKRPVVCFDETSTQLVAETRPPMPPRPGRPRRQDYEYRREGTRNLFLTCEPLAGWRQVAVTQRRTMQDFAHQMRWLVDEAYPEVPVVRVVLDNPVSSTRQALNTHRISSCTGRGGDGATKPKPGNATTNAANQICDCSTKTDRFYGRV